MNEGRPQYKLAPLPEGHEFVEESVWKIRRCVRCGLIIRARRRNGISHWVASRSTALDDIEPLPLPDKCHERPVSWALLDALGDES
jgi:hypothetical protein